MVSRVIRLTFTPFLSGSLWNQRFHRNPQLERLYLAVHYQTGKTRLSIKLYILFVNKRGAPERWLLCTKIVKGSHLFHPAQPEVVL